MLTLSVIVPAYNEEATILLVLEAIAAHPVDGVRFEVIVIDDGSSDGTLDLLKKRPELYTALIAMPRNRGKGAAVKAGLGSATGEYVLFQDADLEYDPAEYRTLLLPVLKRNADAVIGSRIIAPQVTRVHYFWHKVGNSFITFFFNLIYNTTFTDIYSCYLLYRRALVDPGSLRTTGWEQHAEILCGVARRAKGIYEVPVSYYGRTYQEGKKIRARHAIAVLLTIVTERFRR